MKPKPSIFIVEDNEDIGFILESFLSDEGYDVTLLPTARDLRLSLKNELPDLFLMDVMLPDGNGIDLCHKIKADPSSDQVPILIMSAHTNAKAAKECDAEDFIEKPFDLFDLLDKIKLHLPA